MNAIHRNSRKSGIKSSSPKSDRAANLPPDRADIVPAEEDRGGTNMNYMPSARNKKPSRPAAEMRLPHDGDQAETFFAGLEAMLAHPAAAGPDKAVAEAAREWMNVRKACLASDDWCGCTGSKEDEDLDDRLDAAEARFDAVKSKTPFGVALRLWYTSYLGARGFMIDERHLDSVFGDLVRIFPK
jgi:hypothetical protein